MPYFDDEFTVDSMRAARDENGEYYTVPANMNYSEWKKSFVDKNIESKNIAKATSDDIIKSEMKDVIKMMPVDAKASNLFNKNDLAYKNMQNVRPLEGYEDFAIHGNPNQVIYESVSGKDIVISVEDYAEIIRHSKTYQGGNIRLLSCSTGKLDDGFAQKLADILQVEVLAPTEALHIAPNGELFVTDNDELAYLHFIGEKVIETGKWAVFKPREK